MAFYRMALKDVGEILGIPKGEMPMEVKSIEELKPYLERDVEITLQAVIRLKEQVNKLGFNPRKLLTAGQLAITSFLTYCRREKIDWDFTEYNTEKKIRQIVKTKYPREVRQAFRGGMNQAFQIGKFKNVTLIDANGLYAYIMANMDFPDLKTELRNEKPTIGMLNAYMENQIGIARCTIEAPQKGLPYLPVRFQKYTLYVNNRKIRGTWTYLELKKAQKLGYKIMECEWTIRWSKAKINPLRNFINHIYDMEKKMKTREEKSPIKMIRNNLYGKFAQYKQNKDFKIVPRSQIKEWTERGYMPKAPIGDKYICEKLLDEYDPSYTNPIISTMITAGARDFLWDNINKIKPEDLLYCDTDSIAFKGNYLKEFVLGYNLGEWKIESQGDAKFLGEKRYYIDQKAKLSGLMRREITKDIIENEQDVKTRRMIGIKDGIKSGNLEQVGGFREETIEMKPHNKLMMLVPDFIDEVKDYG